MVRIVLFAAFALMAPSAIGQYLDFMEPQKLSSAINSEDEEIMPFLSPDGKTLFFGRVLHAGNIGGKYSGSDVWTSTRANGSWLKAKNTDYPFNSKENNGVIGMSNDGKTAYLLQTSGSKKLRGIYFSKKLSTTWSEPELIPIEGLESQGFAGFYVSPDFDVVIISMNAPDSRGEEDLYITIKDSKGNWSKVKNLGPAINSAGFEIAPFLSADKQRLYFSSSGHEGYGDSDIYFSDRLYSSYETWSTPRNLGQTINTTGFDGYFSIYGDSLAFFASNRNGGRSELYSTEVTVLAGPFIDRKKMLNRSEQEQLIGKNISTRFEFQNEDLELGFAQQERMFYVCNKILTMRNISLQLVVVEENNRTLTQKRINAMTEYIKSIGIEAARVVQIETKKNIKSSSKTVIEVLLYHDEL
jgi:hypothetical protein